MRKERSCGVVVFRPGRDGGRDYLLLHYPGGHWDFPKGHMEKGESEQETALRELREETGIERVTLYEGFRHIIRYQFRAGDGVHVRKEVVFFAGQADPDGIEVSHEHRGHAWHPFESAREKVTFKNARKLLDAAEKYLDRIGVPSQANPA